LDKLAEVLLVLANGSIVDPKYRDHQLIGVYKGRRECHIENDWLLIYKTDDDVIIFERTGTHADLFG
jgi:mRNA interferase YafQ